LFVRNLFLIASRKASYRRQDFLALAFLSN